MGKIEHKGITSEGKHDAIVDKWLFEERADAKKIGRSYASRIMRLTSRCPEIVESSLSGKESQGFSLRQLHMGIPGVWME